MCYISGTVRRAGSQRTQGLFHLLLLHHVLFPPRNRLSTPALPIDNAEETHSIGGFGFQPPLILCCGPSDLSIIGNPVGVNPCQGLSEEDVNVVLIWGVLKFGVGDLYFTQKNREEVNKEETSLSYRWKSNLEG